MSFLRRRMSYASLKYAEFTLSGTFGTAPLVPPCGGTTIIGRKTTGSIGSISPGTFRGYSILDLNQETTYIDSGLGDCVIDTVTTYFNLSGGSALTRNFITKIEFLASGLSLTAASATSAGGGSWQWNDSSGALANGTVRIWYVG